MPTEVQKPWVSNQYFGKSNNLFSPCVDGRLSFVIAMLYDRYGKENPQVVLPHPVAAKLAAPRFLGGMLMFVAYLEKEIGINRKAAIEQTMKAMRNRHLRPTVHVDTHSAPADGVDFADPTQALAYVQSHPLLGCGFADYVWGEEAADVLRLAIRMSAALQVLGGEHQETIAYWNTNPNIVHQLYNGVRDDEHAFCLDAGRSRLIWWDLAKELQRPMLVHHSYVWMYDTYQIVVNRLAGITEFTYTQPPTMIPF